MIVLYCRYCEQSARIICNEHQARTLSHMEINCWGCDNRMQPMSESTALVQGTLHSAIRELTYEEVICAGSGQGLPQERECSRETVEQLLRNKQVHLIGGHNVSENRFCLEWIEFDSGHRMHFGASTHGAIIYKIVEPKEKTCEPSP